MFRIFLAQHSCFPPAGSCVLSGVRGPAECPAPQPGVWGQLSSSANKAIAKWGCSRHLWGVYLFLGTASHLCSAALCWAYQSWLAPGWTCSRPAAPPLLIPLPLVASLHSLHPLPTPPLYSSLPTPPAPQHFDRSWLAHATVKSLLYDVEGTVQNSAALRDADEFAGVAKEIARLRVGVWGGGRL